MGRTFRIDGGYARMPNRWIDARYMAAAPGSVTQVYLFLCRWADNRTGIAVQSIAQMTRMLGSNQDRVRHATKVLQAWHVIERLPSPTHNAVPRWRLLNLPKRAPDYPSDEQIASLRNPTVSEGAAARKADSAPSQGLRGPLLETVPTATVPIEVDPTGAGRTYHTNKYHTTLNQVTSTISSSGAKAPTDDASDAGAPELLSSTKRASEDEDGMAAHPGSDGLDGGATFAGKEEQERRKELVRDLREVLNGHGWSYVLSDEQARAIYTGRDLESVLDVEQLDLWLDECPPF